MAISFKLPKDSTDIIPLKLDMYNYPKALYSSNDELIGQKYKNIFQHFGEVEHVTSNINMTSGKCIICYYVISYQASLINLSE